MVLLEKKKSSLPRQGGDSRYFSSGLCPPVAPRSPSFVLAYTLSPGHPGAAGCWRGSPGSCSLQILRDSRPGAGWLHCCYLGLAIFAPCIYIMEAAAWCSQMPTQANCAFLLDPPAVLLTRGKVAVGRDWTCQTLCPLPPCPKRPEMWTETWGERLDSRVAGEGWTQASGGGGGRGRLAAFPAEDACHCPNPLKSSSLGSRLPASEPVPLPPMCPSFVECEECWRTLVLGCPKKRQVLMSPKLKCRGIKRPFSV